MRRLIYFEGFKEEWSSFKERLKANRYIKTIKTVSWVFIVVAVIFSIYFPNYARLKRLRQANQNLADQNDKFKQEIEALETKLKVIDKNPEVYEKFVRDYLGVAKEGEIVIDINR